LAEHEPAPQPPSLAGFFFFVAVAAGFASDAGVAAAAAGIAGAGVAAGMLAAGVVEVAGVVAAAGVAAGAAGISVAAAAAGAGDALAGVGETAGGVDPPHAATPSAAAANPKIRFRSVISLMFDLPFMVRSVDSTGSDTVTTWPGQGRFWTTPFSPYFVGRFPAFVLHWGS
jgi:hypothetical protein